MASYEVTWVRGDNVTVVDKLDHARVTFTANGLIFILDDGTSTVYSNNIIVRWKRVGP